MRTFKDFIINESFFGGVDVFNKIYNVEYMNLMGEKTVQPFEVNIVRDGAEKYVIEYMFHHKIYKDRLKTNTNYTYKIDKKSIQIKNIEDFIKLLNDSLIYPTFISKLIKERLNYDVVVK